MGSQSTYPFIRIAYVVLLSILTASPLCSQDTPEFLDRQVKFEVENLRLEEFIKVLEEREGLSFSYENSLVQTQRRVSGTQSGMTFRTVFQHAFEKNGIRYRVYGDVIILSPLRSFTLSGFVENSESGERLIGANISLAGTASGTISNNYGFFSLSVPEGNRTIEVSYVGFTKQRVQIELSGDTVLLIQLEPGMEIGEVVIRSGVEREELKTSAISASRIVVSDLEQLPALLGESDVMKMMEFLPGVQLGSEASTGIVVRGGSPEQNLILLDGVPIYNSNHAFGLFSVFNSDAIKNLTLIKGGFPARYGGRLSSVIDVRMKEGSTQKLQGTVDIGTIASKLTLEGPVRKSNSSFLLSARRTYVDLLLPRKFRSKEDIPGFYFYDINAKINTRLKERDRIFLSFYLGRDRFFEEERYTDPDYGLYDNEDNSADWGNTIIQTRWNHVFSKRLFSNLSLIFSTYNLDIDLREDVGDPYEIHTESALYQSGIRDMSCHMDFDFYPSPTHDIKFGANYIYHRFNTGQLHKTAANYFLVDGEEVPAPSGNIDENKQNNPVYASEFRLYAEDDFSIGEKWFTNLGLHFSGFLVENSFYTSLEPRLSSSYRISEKLALKAAYSRMKQYLHLMTHSGMGLPTDMWLPVTSTIKPQYSNQYTLGSVWYLNDNYKINLESYYKTLHQIYAYRSGVDYLAANNQWENNIEMGSGSSYGVELMFSKTNGKLGGWLSYTWSKTERVFEEINHGRPFPYKYDRTHQLSLVSTYRLTPGLTAGLTWIYATGMAYTMATEKFVSLYSLYGWNVPTSGEVEFIDVIDERNNARMPDYHRMDLSLSYRKEYKHLAMVLNFSVYNAYNRFNPYLVYWEDEIGDEADRLQKQVALFSVIPSFSVRFIF
jgi:outer membrane receptor for ferrienterochelin and colicin